jgi:hypothetical protein
MPMIGKEARHGFFPKKWALLKGKGHDYPDKLRRVKFVDPDSGKRLVFLSNSLFMLRR